MPTRNSSIVGPSVGTTKLGGEISWAGQIVVDARSKRAPGSSSAFENATPHSIGGAINPLGLVTGASTNAAKTSAAMRSASLWLRTPRSNRPSWYCASRTPTASIERATRVIRPASARSTLVADGAP